MKPTQEQVIAWAQEAGFEFNSLGATYTSGWLSDLLNSFATLAYEAGRKDENEACAVEVGQRWITFEELKAAHYRHSPEPFDPFRYHKDLSTIFFSRDMAEVIRARREQ